MAFYSRKTPRLPGYDYATHNYYFVTICVHDKKCIFGKPDQVNQLGQIAQHYMQQIEKHFPNVKVDNYIVMPNHVHAIIIIGADLKENGFPSLSTVVGLYKASVSKKIHKIYPNLKVWQRSFHDHIIRDQRGYERIWEYIQYNSQKWEEDCFYKESDKQAEI